MRSIIVLWMAGLQLLSIRAHREMKEKVVEKKGGVLKQKENKSLRVNPAYPALFIIGAMKSGTTSLADAMHRNSAFCAFGEKEKHYFNGAEYDKAASATKYNSEFDPCAKGTITFDATPGYSEKTSVIDRMKETYGHDALATKRFIYILREPISRHFSEYQMDERFCIDSIGDLNRTDQASWRIFRHERACTSVMDENFNPLTNDPAKLPTAKIMDFHEWCMSPRGRRELSRGHYKDITEAYLSTVQRDKFFIMNFESLVTNTSKELMGLNLFLGLQGPQRWNESVSLPKPKKSGTNMARPNISCETVRMLKKYFRDVNGGEIHSWVHSISGARKPPGEQFFSPFTRAQELSCAEFSLGDPRVAAFTEDTLRFSVHHDESKLPARDGGKSKSKAKAKDDVYIPVAKPTDTGGRLKP